MLEITLQPHPTSHEPAVIALTFSIERAAADALQLVYRLRGHLRDIRLAPFTHLRAEDRLWEHTCFELFVRRPHSPAYCELNVATSGAWAAYAFADYREGMRSIEPFAPDIDTAVESEQLTVRVQLPLAQLGFDFSAGPWHLAPAAVIENVAGQRSYWAAHHAGPKPDFHDAAAFVVELPAYPG
jgi:hypothetical protein